MSTSISKPVILSVLNIVNSIGGIVGLSLFNSRRTFFGFYTLTSAYSFYWFVCVFSLLVGGIGGVFHSIPYVKRHTLANQYGIYVMNILCVIMIAFWLGGASSMASLLSDCLTITSSFEDKFFNKDNFNCNPQIVTTTFGFSNVLVWFIISYLSFIRLYSKINTKSSMNDEEQTSTELTQTTSPEEMSSFDETTSSEERN